tara:strand:- start:14 stop:175 length:162 start_codon:yes stop_codon:yes gene_type:complete
MKNVLRRLAELEATLPQERATIDVSKLSDDELRIIASLPKRGERGYAESWSHG